MVDTFIEQFKWFIRGANNLETLAQIEVRIKRITPSFPEELRIEIAKRIIEINLKTEIKTDRTDYKSINLKR